jgi:hypothetical protein
MLRNQARDGGVRGGDIADMELQMTDEITRTPSRPFRARPGTCVALGKHHTAVSNILDVNIMAGGNLGDDEGEKSKIQGGFFRRHTPADTLIPFLEFS